MNAGTVGTFSRITSWEPTRLTKTVFLTEDGTAKNRAGGDLLRGSAEIRQVSILGLAETIVALKTNQALLYGVPRRGTGGIVASTARAAHGDLTRTRKDFKWPDGPGFLLLDYDPPAGSEPMAPAALWAALTGVAPALAHAPALIVSSASGHIFDSRDGSVVRGQRGLHIYLLVADADDIPRAGKALADRLWLAGHGRFDISKSGSLLERTIVDLAVWQPERLDFAAGIFCEAPLEQRRPAPIIHNADAGPLDTSAAMPAVGDPRLAGIKARARRAVAKAAGILRDVWIEDRVADIATAKPDLPEPERVVMRQKLRRAVEKKELFSDFRLTTSNGVSVTVGDLLADPARWHDSRFADPLEPTYGNDNRIAWANLTGIGAPFIFSHAHGGQQFSLTGKVAPSWALPTRHIAAIAADVQAEVSAFFLRVTKRMEAQAAAYRCDDNDDDFLDLNTAAPHVEPPFQVGIVGDCAAGKTRAVILASRAVAEGTP